MNEREYFISKTTLYCQIMISKVERIGKNEDRKNYKRDGILIEAWKCLGEIGWIWLTMLFNKIIRTMQMLDEQRRSVAMPIYKNKGDNKVDLDKRPKYLKINLILFIGE